MEGGENASSSSSSDVCSLNFLSDKEAERSLRKGGGRDGRGREGGREEGREE